MKKLNNVTLVCASDRHIELTIEAIETCKSYFEFEDIMLFTSKYLNYQHSVAINAINCIEDYNDFMLTQLGRFLKTTHALIVQWDGFIVNPDMWDDAWMELDYIGAPCGSNALTYMNGGFDLRSTGLIDYVNQRCKDLVQKKQADDWVICGVLRKELDKQFKFATYEQAKMFSSEYKQTESFGFHSFRMNPKQTLKHIFNSDKAQKYWNTNEKVAVSTGCIGDVVHFLPTARELGISKFSFLLNKGNHFNQQSYDVLKPLLKNQGFKVDLWDEKPIYSPHLHMSAFNKWFDEDEIHLTKTYANVFETKIPDKSYLDLPEEELIYDIAICVSQRYHDFDLNYGHILSYFPNKKIIFIGTMEEATEFQKKHLIKNLEWHYTENCLDSALLINKSKVFVGNANGNMAIAQALYKPVVYEVSTQSHNAIPPYYPSYVVSKRNYPKHYMVDRILEFLELYG